MLLCLVLYLNFKKNVDKSLLYELVSQILIKKMLERMNMSEILMIFLIGLMHDIQNIFSGRISLLIKELFFVDIIKSIVEEKQWSTSPFRRSGRSWITRTTSETCR